MKKSEIKQWFVSNGLDVSTLSFYRDEDGNPVDDCEFTTCDITGEKADCASCVLLTTDHKMTVTLMIADYLVGSHVGKLAGAF
jgi:hypothetical protein